MIGPGSRQFLRKRFLFNSVRSSIDRSAGDWNRQLRLLVVNGEKGANSERIQRAVEGMRGASLFTLPNYAFLGWSDAVEDRSQEIGALAELLAQRNTEASQQTVSVAGNEGIVEWMQRSLTPKLIREEAHEWKTARAQAEADGTSLWHGLTAARSGRSRKNI